MSRSLSTRIKEKLQGWLKAVFSKERDVVQYHTQVRQQQFLIPREFQVVSSQIVTSNFYEIPQHQQVEQGRRVNSFKKFFDEQFEQKEHSIQQSDSPKVQSQEQRTNRHLQKNVSKRTKLNEDKQRVLIQITNDDKEIYKVEMATNQNKDNPEFRIVDERRNPFVQQNGEQNVMKITHEKTTDEGITTSILEIGMDPDIPLNQLEQIAKNKYIKSSVIEPIESPKQVQQSTPKKKGLKRVSSNLDVANEKQEEQQKVLQTTPFFKSAKPTASVIVDKHEPSFKRDLFESLAQQFNKNKQEMSQSPKNNQFSIPQIQQEEVRPEQPIKDQLQQPIQQAPQIIQEVPKVALLPQTEQPMKFGNIFGQPLQQGQKFQLFGETIKMMDNKNEQKDIQQQTIKQDNTEQKPMFSGLLFNNLLKQQIPDTKSEINNSEIKPIIEGISSSQKEIISLSQFEQKSETKMQEQPQQTLQGSALTLPLTNQTAKSEQKQDIKESQVTEQQGSDLKENQIIENKLEQTQLDQAPKQTEDNQQKTISEQQEDKKQQPKEEQSSKPAIVPYQWPSKFQPRPETQLIKKASTLFNSQQKPAEQQEKEIQKAPVQPIQFTPLKPDSEKKQITETPPVALPTMNLDNILEKAKQNSDSKQEQTPNKGELSFFKSLNDALQQKQSDNKSNQQGGGQPQLTLFGNSLKSTPQQEQSTPKQPIFSFLKQEEKTEQPQQQQIQLNSMEKNEQKYSQQAQQTQQSPQLPQLPQLNLNQGFFGIQQPSLFSQQSQQIAAQPQTQQPAQQPEQQQTPFQQLLQQQSMQSGGQVNPFTITPPPLDQAAIQGFFSKKARDIELQQIQSQRSSDQSQRNPLFENRSTGLSIQSPLLLGPSLQVSSGGIATPQIQQSLFVSQPQIQPFQSQTTPIYNNLFQPQGFMQQENQINMTTNYQMNTEYNDNQMQQMNQNSQMMEEPQQFNPIFNSQQQIPQNQYQYQFNQQQNQQQNQIPLPYSQQAMNVTNSLISPQQASLFFSEATVPKGSVITKRPQDNRQRLG